MNPIQTSPTTERSYAARHAQGTISKNPNPNLGGGREERSFLRRNGLGLGIGLAVLSLAVFFVSQVLKHDHSPARRVQTVFIVRPLPAPPPPPPPKTLEPPKEEKMIEQAPMDQPEEKPDDHPKDLPAALTTGLTGPGADGFGLGAGSSGGSGRGSGGHRGSRFGWYAGEVQRTIQGALSRNPVVSQSEFTEKARIWADMSGRVTRVKLGVSTGNSAVDQAIQETLTGLQLPDLPPKDMPMPIVLRLVAHRPG